MNLTSEIALTKDLFVARGSHKECYAHPHDKNLCIKVAYNEPGKKDLEREIFYLTKVLKDRREKCTFLPYYHGAVETDKGPGHVFDLVTDYDGRVSRDLESCFVYRKEIEKAHCVLKSGLLQLRENMLQYLLIPMDLYPFNILCKRESEDKCVFMLINDIGSSSLIPLEYCLDTVAAAKVKRLWNRFIISMTDKYKDDTLIKGLFAGLEFADSRS
ncbi:hypothetical protein AAIR98_001842 [Elusimicrobium simillimum]|uniref:YrbL family protein n=1 Tax=Elusimicrobium simillimum TaxID=3143438 RepID=UPI003C6F07D1